MTEAAANPEAPVELKEARIVSPKERHKDVPLDWPVEFDGKLYESVRIRRVTGREVETFLRTIGSLAPGEPAPPPPMVDCPAEVYDQLDDDDRLKVEEELLPFLPRRLLEVVESIQTITANSPEK